MKSVTLYADNLKGSKKVWKCWIEKDGITVASQWGAVGGKMQSTRDTQRKNAFRSAAEVAVEEFDRRVKRKLRAGYVLEQVQTTGVVATRTTPLNFNRLPRTFAPAKPIRELPMDEAVRLETEGKLIKQRKRDGMRHYIVSGDDGQVRVFSRGLDDMTDHFSRLTQELRLPARTILDAEFVVETANGQDDFIAVSEICRSKAPRAKQTMVYHEQQGKTMFFVVFDILYYQAEPIWTVDYKTRLMLVNAALEDAHQLRGRTQFNHVVPVPVLTKSLMDCLRRVEKLKWEGLVLWRSDQATQVRMNRSPARCNCYKMKPMREDDFVATGFELGKGKNANVVGALKLAYYGGHGPGPVHKGLVLTPVGNVGTGLNDATRKEALTWQYPCVVQVEYERMSDTGLRFPAFKRKRPDKKPQECVIQG
jgi:ATP-dependent DNA ligase